MHEKLQHLSSEEIISLKAKYYEGEIKVSALLEQYNIDIIPSKFISILPPEKHTDCLTSAPMAQI